LARYRERGWKGKEMNLLWMRERNEKFGGGKYKNVSKCGNIWETFGK